MLISMFWLVSILCSFYFLAGGLSIKTTMQKIYHFPVVAAMFALFVTGCSVTGSEDEEYSRWTFSGTVVDSESGAGLKNVQISYQSSSKSAKTAETDEDGNFYIKDLPYGSLNFSFSYTQVKDKDTLRYTPKVLNISSSGESSKMEGVLAGTAVIVRLSPLNAKLTGELYVTEASTGKKTPLEDVQLYLEHQDTAYINLDSKSFEASTDENGVFTFAGLPADTGLVLKVSPITYKGQRYTSADINLPRLKSAYENNLGRIFLVEDSTVTPDPVIKKSNVLDENQKGLENVSQLEIPYFVFGEKLSSSNLSVTVTADTNIFFVEPRVSNDTIFLDHNEAFPPSAEVSVKIVAYGAESGERIAVSLSESSAFKTGRGIYAVTSNTWASNENFKASFGISDTMWVKFSKNISTNTDRIQWNYVSEVDCSIYANGYYANANSWVNKDTLFVQLLEGILKGRSQGDSVGMNITVYAEDGSYLDKFILRTELVVPATASSSSSVSSSSSASDEG